MNHLSLEIKSGCVLHRTEIYIYSYKEILQTGEKIQVFNSFYIKYFFLKTY